MVKRALSPLERVTCALLTTIDRPWMPVKPIDLPSIHNCAIDQLVRKGLIEAKVPIEVLVVESGQTIRSSWQVSGEFEERLLQAVQGFLHRHRVVGKESHIKEWDYAAVRLSPMGEARKAVLAEIFSTKQEPSEEEFGVIESVTGGPSGDGGSRASGKVQFIEGDEPAPFCPAPAGNTSTSNGQLASASLAEGGEQQVASDCHPEQKEVPAPKATQTHGPVEEKLDAVLLMLKQKVAVGKFGRWKPRDMPHNNKIVGHLLDALPDVSSRDAARILGVRSHSQVTRTDIWKQRRGGDGPDASSNAEHHQNMQYDEDARAQDPAKVVAAREEHAAQLRKVITELGMTSMFQGIDDDAKLCADLEKLTRKNPAAFKRITDAWVVQSTAPHQPEDL